MIYDRTYHLNDLELGILGKYLSLFYSKKDRLVFFDIGACEGGSSMRYARNYPNSVVYSVEPLPNNIDIIRENIKKTGTNNIEIVECAFSDRVGTEPFFLSSGTPDRFKRKQVDWDFGNKSSSLLSPDKATLVTPWLKFQDQKMIQTQTLKNFCDSRDIDHIHFIHMDVQGAELKVLQGAGEMLKNVDNIWLEVETISLYKDQPLKKDIERFLSGYGFFKVIDKVYGFSGDQLWVRKELLKTKKGFIFFWGKRVERLLHWMIAYPVKFAYLIRVIQMKYKKD